MFGNMGKLMKLAGEMRTKLPELKAKLAASEYTSEAGGGAISATVNGKMQLVAIDISPEVLEDSGVSKDMLEDMIRAAVGGAQHKAAVAAEQAMKELTGGVDIPGLSDMF
jgi:DNA-binding YbaB/EbfC family protein